ncbi:MAG: GtrA family protein [Terriglobales bacterium]|jgi:dolichol-phosphate mannosyltransferase|nr:GtrA family protein [Terriglobales bacterium]
MSNRPNLNFAWRRPAKFAFVGAMGIIVQLVALHWLAETECGYLIATIISVEAAVLHNFVWHEKFTWRDRGGFTSARLGARLLRFHLSNGLISIAGNLLLMRIFVGEFGMLLIPANLLSITACCLTNFIASDRWVFVIASGATGTDGTRPR